MNKGVFPNELKRADIKPIYEKESRNEKEKLRKSLDSRGGASAALLTDLSKAFDCLTHD